MNESEKAIYFINVKRSLIVVALMWSLFMVLFVLPCGVREAQSLRIYASGFVWLFGLFLLGDGVRRVDKCIYEVNRVHEEYFRKERESLRRKARLDAILHGMPDAVVFVDTDNRIVLTNPGFSKLTGYSSEEVKGRSPDFLYTIPESLRKPQGDGDDGIDNPRQTVFEINCRLKDGKVIPTETHVVHVRSHDGTVIGFLTVTRDISQRRVAEIEKEKLEAKLSQMYKMEAIGTLAAGIAHDFNNILGIIFINSEMALEDISDGNSARVNIDRIVLASKRARNLVKQILVCSRQIENELIPLMPGVLLKESLQLLEASAPSTVNIVKDVDDDYQSIMMDPAQVRQMLMNLFSNALHAMNDKGTLEVTGQVIELDEVDVAHQQDLLPGLFFKLSVSDTGVGMDQRVQRRIFDPFFTTGEAGNGTGLSNVMETVNRHGAMITVVSAPGMGTTIHVYFPLVESEAASQEEAGDTLSGDERILLVDDEVMLIEMVGQYLQRRGYQVTVKTASLDAFEAFIVDPEAFDIVVTDQTMPDMTGSELAKELLEIRPDLPIILFSGFSKKISRKGVEELGIRDFLYKPFDGGKLLQSIRGVLDKKS
jgi:PAS domain S-box-containing protein